MTSITDDEPEGVGQSRPNEVREKLDVLIARLLLNTSEYVMAAERTVAHFRLGGGSGLQLSSKTYGDVVDSIGVQSAVEEEAEHRGTDPATHVHICSSTIVDQASPDLEDGVTTATHAEQVFGPPELPTPVGKGAEASRPDEVPTATSSRRSRSRDQEGSSGPSSSDARRIEKPIQPKKSLPKRTKSDILKLSMGSVSWDDIFPEAQVGQAGNRKITGTVHKNTTTAADNDPPLGTAPSRILTRAKTKAMADTASSSRRGRRRPQG